MADKAIQPGSVLAGKYSVEKVIGSGGMGIVVKARQAGLDRPVAIKVLLDAYRDRPEFVERFYREAKAAARVRGEHVAQVFDVGRTEHGEPYLAMEYLEGEDLHHVLQREKFLALDVAIDLMREACAGVAEIHGARVVHRDLKPANFFLAKTQSGKTTLKIIDFGISRVEDSASKLTHTQASLGTAYYMAPEQIERPKEADFRVDIWALGVIFFELLTGEMPFAGETLAAIIANVIRNTRRTARSIQPGIPAEADAIIDRCLAPSPDGRYATALDLSAALAKLSANHAMRTIASDTPMFRGQTQTIESPYSRESVVPELDLPGTRGSAGAIPVGPGSSGSLNAYAPASSPRMQSTPSLPSMPSAPSAPGSGRFTQKIEFDQFDGGSSPKLEVDAPSRVRAAGESKRQTVDPMLRSIATAEHSPPPGKRPKLASIALGAASVAAVLSLSMIVAIPRMAASSVHAAAAEAGMAVTSDSPSLTIHGVEFSNLDVAWNALPGTSFHAARAHTSLSGNDLAMTGADLTSTSSFEDLSRAMKSSELGTAKTLRVDDLKFSYTPTPGIMIQGDGANLSVKTGSNGDRTMSLTAPRVTLQTIAGAFGPFAMSIDESDAESAIHLTTGKGTSSASSADITFKAGEAHVTMHAPRAARSVFGKSLGLASDDPVEIAAELDVTSGAAGDLSGTGSFAAFGVSLGAGPMDLAWDFRVTGHDDAIKAESVKAKIGPFSGEIQGQWAMAEPKRAFFTFRTKAVPCVDIARAREKNGDLAALAADLAAFVGVAQMTGSANASGVVTLVGESPPRAWTSISRNDTCGVTIFPGKP